MDLLRISKLADRLRDWKLAAAAKGVYWEIRERVRLTEPVDIGTHNLEWVDLVEDGKSEDGRVLWYQVFEVRP